MGGALVLGLALAVAAPAQAGAAGAGVIQVPGDFVPTLSDTRTTGHYEVQGTGLHIRTEGTGSTDKVAEYVATDTPLMTAGEPGMEYTNTADGLPGLQLVVDFDGNGSSDGILVGETAYDGDWWVNDGAQQFVKDRAPSHSGGSGRANHGTLDQWRTAFSHAVVTAFGFSLGSGVKGDGLLHAIDFAGTRYTFAADVVLENKGQCKNGGWATSTYPKFRNQGDCVSSFASGKKSSDKK
jgi:hypothetical protein